MSRTEAGLPEQRFIFCCFSRHYKITEDMFGAWMEILRATGNSVLWLARDSACSEASLRSTAERAGIAHDRLIFANRIDPDLYMSRMRLADLFLDTFPYNAGTVASDALRMELPLLTLCGEAFASRMAGSLLTSLNRPEGIATSRAEYIAKAIRLATDADAYRSFRAGFTYVAWAHSVGNIERFTRDFEAVLHDIRLEPIPQMKATPMEPIALHEVILPGPRNERCLDDLPGADYQVVLERLHDALHPQTYFGIGVDTGKTLALARCPSIAVDPQFSCVELSCIKQVIAKPSLMLFQTTSDDFFERFRPDVLFGHSVEFAFLDGMHHCENLLRDFINTERCCQVGSIIALHGCLPVELSMANRNLGLQSIDHRRKDMWTGDVWRTALLLKRRRPDLSMMTLDAAPTGLVLITHLDPGSRLLVDRYDECVSEMLSWSLEDMGLAAYHSEMEVQSTHVLDRHEDISRRFGRQTTMLVPTPQEPALEQILVEAIEHHHAGRTDDAERLYQTVLASPSAPAIASFSFGLLCATQDRLQEAAAAYRHAIAIKPDFVDAYINLGTVVLALGRREEAVTIFRDAIAISPENAMALGNLGKALQDLGRIDEAIDTYLAAVTLKPDDAGIQMNYGAALLDRQAWAESAAVTRYAIALQPDSAMAHVNLGAALFNLGLYEEALVACRRAMALRPESAATLTSLGGVMVELGALPEAEILCRRATTLDPAIPNAHLNLSHALMAMNRLDEAEMSVRQAIALRPDAADYHYGLAHILLLKGDMEAGWAEYDWRWKLPAFAARSHILAALWQPLWAGEDIGGKTILIFTEQGLGDMIQYVRYLPLVVRKAGRVVVVVAPPVRRLFESIKGITIVSLADTPLSDFDVYCPLLSLPRVLAGEINGVSTGVPYLRADPADQMRWSRRIGGDALRVGIVWAGNPAHKRDRSRSPHLASVMPLFSVPDVDFISLQVGQGREDCDAFPLPPNVLDLGGEVTDLAETAAIMSGLDLMISPDTCPLHLAGALGVQSWAMIPFAPHFPWLLGRTDTPWYPSMRLYRQEQHELDWSSVVARIATDLAVLARSKPERA
jgi:predicted O-linked N-acetylglucosamine transferase (SPINDLY family)